MVKILIGIVTYSKQSYILNEFTNCIKKQTVQCDILFVVNNGESKYLKEIKSKGFEAVEDPINANSRIEKIVNGRKYLRNHALKNGYDYLMFVDSDVLIPPHAVQTLLDTKTDVAVGAYLNAFDLGGEKVIAPVLFKDLGDGNCQLYTYEGVAIPKIIEIGASGLACALISRKVLEKIDIRTMNNSSTGGEDIAFFLDARASGFKCLANTSVKCVHAPYPLTDPRAKLFDWKKRVEDNTVNVSVDY